MMWLFGKKKQVTTILPIPMHLQDIMIPVGNSNSELEVTGIIKCPCGSEIFEIWESNDRQLVKIVCKECKTEYILFDSGKHGWNGFVCGDDFLDREMPFEKHLCSECAEDVFGVVVRISSQGKEDFKEECLSNDDAFTLEDWVNAFEWITISLSCKKCVLSDKEWLTLETM